MKRRTLVRHLRKHGCYFIREGGRHSRWGKRHLGGQISTSVPRHNEIGKWLVEKICQMLRAFGINIKHRYVKAGDALYSNDNKSSVYEYTTSLSDAWKAKRIEKNDSQSDMMNAYFSFDF